MKTLVKVVIVITGYLVMAGIACLIRARLEPQLYQWERDRNIPIQVSGHHSEAWPAVLFAYSVFWFYALPALACYWMAMRARERSVVRFKERQKIEREIARIEAEL
jgi:hypothetical protein